MDTSPTVEQILNDLKNGGQQGAAILYSRYAHRLIGLANTRLNQRVRLKVDAEDVVQSVFRTFFVRQANGDFVIRNWDDFWAILSVITARKCSKVTRFYLADRRGGGRVQQPVTPGNSSDSQYQVQEPESIEPDPADLVILSELLDRLFADLTDDQRAIVKMRLAGYEIREIAEHVKRSERTVGRVLHQTRERLCRLGGDN